MVEGFAIKGDGIRKGGITGLGYSEHSLAVQSLFYVYDALLTEFQPRL